MTTDPAELRADRLADAHVCIADGAHHRATRHTADECPTAPEPDPFTDGTTLLTHETDEYAARLSRDADGRHVLYWTDHVVNDWSETYDHVATALARYALLIEACPEDDPEQTRGRGFHHPDAATFETAWLDNLDTFLSAPFATGMDDESTPTRDSRPAWTITRQDLAEQVGRDLTDDEVERFAEHLPLTTVDQCVTAVLDSLNLTGDES